MTRLSRTGLLDRAVSPLIISLSTVNLLLLILIIAFVARSLAASLLGK